ncbi:MAG: membrane protein insertion efficiency factor YidD [Nitrospiria bacterium]
MKTGIIVIIKGYQNIISPLLPPACRFYPSCSQYAIETIQRYGCLEGLKRAAQRLLRCHPFHPGGYDPVD